ncbi:TorF family putative porin [Rhizorhabdus argentea]|uniref:TorF family putative porin n=1 Tax=Rhizorhabdus argentea TaxID=1387174 RepID=UPI0030EE9DB8
MRASMIGLSALALVASAAPALAQDDVKEFTLTGSAALVSDYRFRGISQSDRRLAAQASATITHESGLYASFWSSSIASDTVYPGANAELDLIAGYSKTISGFTLDGGVLYYVYANADAHVNSDFFEPYGSIKTTVGPVTAKGGFAYAFKQKATLSPINPAGHTKDDNLYLYGEVSGSIPDTGFSLLGHVGYSKGRSYLTLGLKDYMDWNVGASYTWRNATFTVSYVDTDIKSRFGVYGSHNRNQVKGGVVGAATYAF